jgi:hypothetical protein
MKEYIVAVEDDVIAYEEDSVGYIRRQKKLIRCEECKWKQGYECVRFADVRPFPDDYCSRAEQKETT